MGQQNISYFYGLSVLLAAFCSSSLAQNTDGTGLGGARAGGLSGPRSGIGVRNNPVVKPAPSLTPSQVLNPRGSLSTGQVLNPEPSLNRPRSGVSVPGANATTPPVGTRNRSDRSVVIDNRNKLTTSSPAGSTRPSQKDIPAGEKILESTVALDRRLAKVAPDKGWSERLSLDSLRAVPIFSEQPADDDVRKKLEEILKEYQAVADDAQHTNIASLPEFAQTLTALKDYLTPPHVVRQRHLSRYFYELGNQLRRYKNGEPWAEYLALPEELQTSSSKQTAAAKPALIKLLGRFDKLAGDDTYKKVTTLPAFHLAHNALRVSVDQATP